MLALPAAAQEQQPRPPADKSAGAQPAPQREGFFDALGRWFEKSNADFKSSLGKMKSSIEEFNEKAGKAAKDAVSATATATKDAGEALSKLPNTRIVDGRERCELAPNGSPDCRTAAESVCKAKGFGGGKSFETQSAQKCSARALLTRNDADCSTETFVTRALCQ
jgi:hypothetical protein